jgi:Uma2 family endonuclease
MQTHLVRKRFNVDEYYKMLDTGILREGERVELLDGDILQMSSMGARHAATVYRIDKILTRMFGDQAMVRGQLPLHVDKFSEPEPDIAVVRPRSDAYVTAHPTPDDVLLLVEIADTTLEFDCEVKIPVYAIAQIQEVWIVDLTSDRFSIYQHPSGDGYQSMVHRARGDSISPKTRPDITVQISELLS